MLYAAADVKVQGMGEVKVARFRIGQVVRHRIFPFRGVIFDVDPEFANTEDWYNAIPAEVRPARDQPYYHLLAENEETEYVAYVSEQNLIDDSSGTKARFYSAQAWINCPAWRAPALP